LFQPNIYYLIIVARAQVFGHARSGVPFRPFRKYIFCSGTRAGSPRKHADNRSERQLPRAGEARRPDASFRASFGETDSGSGCASTSRSARGFSTELSQGESNVCGVHACARVARRNTLSLSLFLSPSLRFLPSSRSLSPTVSHALPSTLKIAAVAARASPFFPSGSLRKRPS